MRSSRALFASIVLASPFAVPRAALAQAQPTQAPPALQQPPAAPPLVPGPAAQIAPAAQGATFAPWVYGAPASYWARTLPAFERRSTAMMVTGITATTLGVLLMIVGTIAYEAGDACSGGADEPPLPPEAGIRNNGQFIPCRESAARTTGMMLLVAGGMTSAAGIPLWIVGQSDVRIPREGSPTRDARAPRLVLRPGPGGLRLSF